MNDEFKAIIRVGSGKAVYKSGSIETMYGVFDVKSANVDHALSMLAACFPGV